MILQLDRLAFPRTASKNAALRKDATSRRFGHCRLGSTERRQRLQGMRHIIAEAYTLGRHEDTKALPRPFPQAAARASHRPLCERRPLGPISATIRGSVVKSTNLKSEVHFSLAAARRISRDPQGDQYPRPQSHRGRAERNWPANNHSSPPARDLRWVECHSLATRTDSTR
jgi:hypothetical protein